MPTTVLVIGIAAMAAYAFAWMEFPGRDTLFLVVVGLLIVPIQIALIPMAKLYGCARDLRLDPRRGAVPRRLRTAVRDLPAP